MRYRSLAAAFLLSCLYSSAFSQKPVVTEGIIVHLEKFPTKYVEPRNVDIWLPRGYDSLQRYDVLYVHDGQVMFDPGLGSLSKEEWGLDEMMSKLMAQKKIKNSIVVAIWNSGEGRRADYTPQKPTESLPQPLLEGLYNQYGAKPGDPFYNRKVRSDAYLKFIVSELKPYIDSHYATYHSPKHTHIMGSSMGGLISLYAICEYPEIFGSAACLSTHWPVLFSMEKNPFPNAIFEYLKKKLPDSKSHRIYFDYGDKTLDALYPPLQKRADVLMKKAGYTSANWKTRFFPGEEHSERAWKKRLDVPLLFMLSR